MLWGEQDGVFNIQVQTRPMQIEFGSTAAHSAVFSHGWPSDEVLCPVTSISSLIKKYLEILCFYIHYVIIGGLQAIVKLFCEYTDTGEVWEIVSMIQFYRTEM